MTFGGLALGAWCWGAVADWRDLPFTLHAAAVFLLVATLITRRFAPMPRPDEGRVEG